MRKTASYILCLVVLLAGPALRAQNNGDAINDATREAVRRSEMILELQQLLKGAREARDQMALERSAQLYQQSYDLLKKIGGPAADPADGSLGKCRILGLR